MTKEREALKMALEALEEAHYKHEHRQDATKRGQAITAIEAALAQASDSVEQEPTTDTEFINRGCHYQTELTQPERISAPCRCGKETNGWCMANSCAKAGLAQPEQEPVAWKPPTALRRQHD